MISASVPANESARLKALHLYGALDTLPDAPFDEVTRLAVHLCNTPIAVISLVDEHREWFKSRVGFNWIELPRPHSLGAHAILHDGMLVVADTAKDPRFAGSAEAWGGEEIRFYAAVPLLTPQDAFPLGTLAVMDYRPRRLAVEQTEALRILARQVVTQLELHRHILDIERRVEKHRRTEEQLRFSEQFYHALVETIPQNIFRKDLQGCFTFANERFCKAVGRSYSELIGKTDFDFYPREMAAKFQEDDLRVMSTRLPLDVIEANQTPSGDRVYVHVVKTPLEDADGKVIGIQGIFYDVTARKRIEQALAYERDLLGALLGNIPDRIFFKDVNSRFLRISDSMAKRLGLPHPDEVVGKTDFDFYPAEDAQQFLRDEQHIVLTGLPVENKLEKLIDRDGRVSWVSATKVPLRNKNDVITGIIGISRDVSEIKQAENALRQAEEKYRSIYERSVEGIFQTTEDGKFLTANPALARIYGYSSTEELIAALTDISHQLYVNPERREEFSRLMREKGEIVGFESEIYQKDGSKIWISEAARTVRDSVTGRLLYFEGAVEDVTARKLAELEREKAREAALETARVKAQFLANVSHEIRTPMWAITGMTDFLLDTRLAPEQRELVETIRNSADTLITVINDVLDFSKIEAGRLTIETTDVELTDVVEGAVDLLAERAQRKGIDLACRLGPDVPNLIRSDPVRLRQIIVNLVSNAVKFTERGEVVVRVLKKSQAGEGVTLRFEVSDTGIGISPEAQKRIFQEFTQADGSTTRKHGGTGLGLTISKQLVQLMGGTIGVESTLDRGSVFWFELSVGCQPSMGSPGVERLLERVSGLRVMVVDDSVTQREIMLERLKVWQAIGTEESSPATALERLRSAAAAGEAFKVVIVEMDLRDQDGLAFTQAIKADETIRSTRVILVAPVGQRVSPSVMAATGIAACLSKPIRQTRLLEALADAAPGTARGAEVPSVEVLTPARASAEAAKSIRILLAEDNPVNQKVALKQLKKLGYHADAVANGTAVLDALQRSPYEVILMDCQMPELDGYEVTRRIREGERGSWMHSRSAPYIIALTANAMRGDRERCLAVGMNDYLTKPLHLADLESALVRAVQKVNPTPRPATPPTSEVIDLGIIAGLRELREPGGSDPLADLIDLFLRDARPRLEKMDLAVAEKDGAKLVAAAHTLKGSASNLGARRLASLCQTLEKHAKSGEMREAAATLSEVSTEFDLVQQSLMSEREK